MCGDSMIVTHQSVNPSVWLRAQISLVLILAAHHFAPAPHTIGE